MTKRQIVGRIGEDVASQFLQRKGYKVVAINYRQPWGEIDIIAEKDEIVRFVEVKTVSREINRPAPGYIGVSPEDHLDSRKLEKLARTAALYMESRGDKREYQIDAVAILLDPATRKARCTLYEQIL